jgi:signal transduction histidine kinase/CheY-like chemotaxis protein
MLRTRLLQLYIWLTIPLGAVVCGFALSQLRSEGITLQFLLLALITVSITSRIAVRVPGLTSSITVSDTFIFLTILLFGGNQATLVAAAEGVCSASRISRKPRTLLFNASAMAIATYLTGQVWEVYSGAAGADTQTITTGYLITLCCMVLVQYAVNSVLATVYETLKSGESLWRTWRKYYLWTSITYVAGGSGAAVTAKLIMSQGFHSVLIAAPIIGIIYFTYRTYLKNLEAAKAQAEQARRHVEELNEYIRAQERIREQFSQVEKMSALGELASGVAHDFNNCLAGILGRAELMMRQTQDPKSLRGLEIIRKAAQDGAQTVKRIQDFARQRQDRDFQPVAIDQVLLDVSEMTRPRWKNYAEAAGVHINLELKNDSGAFVMGDISELRDVLVNMIFNAVDAMPHGGTLTLAAEVVGELVEVSVTDTGLGMTPQVRSRVFNPFFTTKGVSGLGLGLAVSYGIVSRHNGAIQVESEVGKGTKFKIELPLAQGLTKPRQSSSDVSNAKRARSKMIKILVVDDEERVRQLLCEILEESGYEVIMANNARDGLALFDQDDFDAVFTDIGMPGMNGWEFSRAIRERNRLIPLAVITGWGEIISETEKTSAGVDWVLTKPFSVDEILDVTEEVVRRKKLQPGFPPLTLVTA